MNDSTDDTFDVWVNDIHCGDVIETLREMPDSSVHSVVTSPPYFGLRDYGEEGQLGLEPTLNEYVENLVDVGDEVRRVLRPDGNWWLNLGDSFAGSGRGQWSGNNDQPKEAYTPESGELPPQEKTYRRKTKLMVPHRVVIALIDAGWVARADAVWEKTNPMPNPVTDRLNEVKEYLFHLAPNPDYWFDLDAIREPHKDSTIERESYGKRTAGEWVDGMETNHNGSGHVGIHPNGKNPGDIFKVSTQSFPDAHFAVYPEELVTPLIKSSCPPKVCAACGTPYEREQIEGDILANPNDRPQKTRAIEMYENSDLTRDHLEAARAVGFGDAGQGKATQSGTGRNTDRVEELAAEAKELLGGYFREFVSPPKTLSDWHQSCECDTDETKPGIVLDPFSGAGTTALVAKQLGRRFAGIELNPEYVAMSQKRIGIDVDEPERLLEEEETAITSFIDGPGVDR